ncbi:ATP-grasp domain-containing protein [Psychroserpens ponticola]|uniref:ATP-grasp domain-containing protein n=1 Tax=Psychroserpens ponticola TaxID=2932268 RepID=A0ABY7RZL0_9FLAO|nr:ATP-grasp domain-containing protein [Psychroserpens ponticola]WCO02517.1 ATP-grasp domain-containing protein [Psychroserpens ponticola]
MDEKRIIVTGIGGNVGQGVIRNIRATHFNIKVIGTNVEDFSAGNHLCDVFYKVPFAYDEAAYIASIKDIVVKEHIDLILPTTDFEIFYLSKHQNEISCEIAVSENKTAAYYLDKYTTFLHLKKHDIPFANSFLPSEYNNEYSSFILKPRQGRGSRGLQINPKDYKTFSDDEYMIQELHEGVEITTAFYVNKSNELHGFITFERSLENGTTTHCKVVSVYDSALKKILLDIIKVSHIKGSANLQAIVTKTGKIEPFEINCRISGTNSIRANFGFKDVTYTLEEWLFNQTPSQPIIEKGIATRILMDVIYKNTNDFKEAKDNSATHYIY